MKTRLHRRLLPRGRHSLLAATLISAAASGAAGQTAAPPDRFFDSNAVQIRYVERGAGPAVVMLHGYTGTRDRHFVANGVFDTIAILKQLWSAASSR